ncbi:CotS family spore coat protein [Paenibacillus crassostreae]|uniref:Uncharacterized protein n=1 Tax=Paenibacillus crassostreae TaxID=1763538 RepID=A0A167FGD3_9BACL|nr:CotS family spore coat protein [Paenibacillus crassostreae]AOZ94430.1 hypothetical protein LPB68_20970 [Paenibacillus crassostreae]OAB76533.1 hypothetical protein PNBC_03770 [Paenibacillus crassostreae]
MGNKDIISQQDLSVGLQLMSEQYPHIKVHEAAVIQDGGIKTIWKLETSEGTVCLKRIRKSLPIVDYTTKVQTYLFNKGALVAEIIPTKDSELYFVLDGYGLVLYRWIVGSDLDMEGIPEHLEHGLSGLAQFHLQTVGFVPPPGSQVYNRMGVWPDNYTSMLEEFLKWKSIAVSETSEFHKKYLNHIDEIIAMAEYSIELLNKSCYAEWVESIGDYGYMCHQDYGKGNALLTEQGVYVLDLDNLAYDIPLRDVRKLIMKRMKEVGEWKANELNRWVCAYAAVLPLSADQKRILYIDLLFPHEFHGTCKNVFNKGKPGELKKINQSYLAETAKLPTLNLVLK